MECVCYIVGVGHEVVFMIVGLRWVGRLHAGRLCVYVSY